ncbi:MAG: type III-B CRISPR module-associated protein Cmr5 [Deltaproteobacteria bacterium]|nr:type III-B CRISPR module-associated protein Cmr5 [Deltaproteobacteria bacterium]
MQSKSQRFSDVVFTRVQQIAQSQQQGGENDRRARKYKSLCKRSGGVLRNSGLMQYLAFLKARGQRPSEYHHQILYLHLQDEIRVLGMIGGNVDLFDYSRQTGLPVYMRLTREVLLLLQWHKRLADTLIQGDASEGEDEP